MSGTRLRGVIEDELRDIEEPVALLLSGGVDSALLFKVLLDLGKDFKAYSFTLSDRESKDFMRARGLCERFGAEFQSILVPRDEESVVAAIHRIKKKGGRTKTDFECFFPMLYAYQEINERTIVSGLGADGHFCISKKGILHHKHDVDGFRKAYCDEPTRCQRHLHSAFCSKTKKKHVMPYLSRFVSDVLDGLTWDELNKPKQKWKIHECDPDFFNETGFPKHTNYQKGDSGISDLFHKLVDSPHNSRNSLSSIGVINSIIKNHGQLSLDF